MGTITSNIGLISGINYQDLVNKLIQVQSGPVDQQTANNKTADTQRTAITQLEALMLSLQFNTNKLGTSSLYNQRTIASSNESALTATVSGQPQTGQYQFTPVQLAQSQQFQSSRFTSNSTPIGAGTITLQNGGFVDRGAALDLLNSGDGVTRGQIKITDRSGASSVIDLRFARTVDDVLQAINSDANISVTASAVGDRLKLTDTSGQTASNLIVQEVNGGTTAASLGISGISAAANFATGSDVLKLFNDVSLNLLNDGGGVRFNNFLSDLQISFRDGTTQSVDFHKLATTGASPTPGTNELTLKDVLDTLNSVAPTKLQASISADGDHLVLTDLTTDTGGTFGVSALNGSKAAADLGLTATAVGGTLTGGRLLGGLDTVLLNSLNGGAGFGTLGSIDITARTGGIPTTISLASAKTLDDVVTAINAAGLGVKAQTNDAGNGIEIVDTTGSTSSNLIIANHDGTNTADKLGLTVNAATTSQSSGSLHLRTVNENSLLSSLNGGDGVGVGSLRITDTNGSTAIVKVDNTVKTVGDLLHAINVQGLGLTAQINDTGDGIALVDTAHGAGTLTVSSASGTAAKDLHLLGAATTVDIGGTPTQVIDGTSAVTITLSATDTLTDLVTKINASGIGVQAAATNDGSTVKPFRLTLFNSRTGTPGRLLVDTSGVNFSFNETAASQDALVVLGSINSPSSVLASSSNNSFSTLVPGITVNLKGASLDPVTVTVGSTNSNLSDTLQGIVDAYNKVQSGIGTLTKFDSDSNSAAILQGDSTILRVSTDLSNLLAGTISGAGSLRSLAQVGVKIGQDGTATFDEDAFQAAYDRDPQGVQDLLSSKDTGVSDRFKKLIDSLAGAGSSVLVSRAQTLSQKIDDGQKRIDFLNARLDVLRTRLLTQFANSETLIAKIKSNQSAIDAIQPFSFLSYAKSSG
jgi:flagellar hook-associated protein 2